MALLLCARPLQAVAPHILRAPARALLPRAPSISFARLSKCDLPLFQASFPRSSFSRMAGSASASDAAEDSIYDFTVKSYRCLDNVKETAAARDGFQLARWLSTTTERASGASKDFSVEAPKQNGEEAAKESNKKEPEAATKAASDATRKVGEKATKAGEDVIKSEVGEKKLQDLLKETQDLLKEKDKMVVQAKQQVLTHLAEVENVRGRTRRDAESIKQHAVQTFATDLLDMADNLARAATSVPENVRSEVLASDTSGNAKLLKSLLEGVDMTQKQLMKIFSKFGVEKYDPLGETYDPQHHLAITEVEDETKEPQTIVNIVKSGYLLKDKLIRPAEVNIVKKRAEAK